MKISPDEKSYFFGMVKTAPRCGIYIDLILVRFMFSKPYKLDNGLSWDFGIWVPSTSVPIALCRMYFIVEWIGKRLNLRLAELAIKHSNNEKYSHRWQYGGVNGD